MARAWSIASASLSFVLTLAGCSGGTSDDAGAGGVGGGGVGGGSGGGGSGGGGTADTCTPAGNVCDCGCDSGSTLVMGLTCPQGPPGSGACSAMCCSPVSGAGGTGATSGAGGASTGGTAGTGGGGGSAATSGAGGTGAAAGAGGTGASGGSPGTGGTGGGGGTGGSATFWSPAPGTTWQWQLTETIDTSLDVDMYDIDLFDVPQSTISSLQSQGRIVICYFSAGSREEWRPDASQLTSSAGNPLDGWDGERWLDTRTSEVRQVMRSRLDLAATKGCDGVEPDNVDGYTNNTGFPLTEADQLDYNRFLASEAHARGLSVGLKNAVDLVPQLVSEFDWALNEECLEFNECSTTAPFIQAGKAVFHVEYVNSQSQGSSKINQVCGDSTTSGFSTLVKTFDLDAWRLACP